MTGNPTAPQPAPYIGPALVSIPAATLTGVDGRPIRVEVHLAHGVLPGFQVVGVPDAPCREARDRVRAALLTSGFPWPTGRITVNFAPPGLPRLGASLDLAIAIGVLATSGWIDPHALEDRAFLGELGLDGTLRPVAGALGLVEVLDEPEVIVAPASVTEARLTGRHAIRTAPNLRDLVDTLNSVRPWPRWPTEPPLGLAVEKPEAELADVVGLPQARYALEVAAAGGHHLLLIGSPGSSKTMLAHRLGGLLPGLLGDEALEVTRIHSATGVSLPAGGLIRRPPFRAPSAGASPVSLLGGSGALLPGEVSLAHRGVLFLDDLPEFAPVGLDGIRSAIDHGTIRIARAMTSTVLPTRFLLVAATWPCPCGAAGTAEDCRCSEAARARFGRRVPGPLLDRFDLRVNLDVDPADNDGVPIPVPVEGETTAAVAPRVAAARGRARDRGVRTNAELTRVQLAELAPPTPEARRRLDKALRAGRLTGRGAEAVLRVALTIADLEGDRVPVRGAHITAALALRSALLPTDG